MPDINNHAYRDLIVWNKAMEFATRVISQLEDIESSRRHYRLFEQLEAAVTSVPMNIAEGKGRESKKEYIHHLYIARGSIYETLTLLEIFHSLGWIQNETYNEFENLASEIIRMLKGLINSISKSL